MQSTKDGPARERLTDRLVEATLRLNFLENELRLLDATSTELKLSEEEKASRLASIEQALAQAREDHSALLHRVWKTRMSESK